jgi:hypothetical protein
MSSSSFALEHIIYPELRSLYNYQSKEECFEDRVNHREVWYEMIRDFNKDNQLRLTKLIMSGNDIYVGMRNSRELDACIEHDVFDCIVWVDASRRVSAEDIRSCNITPNMANIVIDNNGSIEELRMHAATFVCNFETWIEDRHDIESQYEDSI